MKVVLVCSHDVCKVTNTTSGDVINMQEKIPVISLCFERRVAPGAKRTEFADPRQN